MAEASSVEFYRVLERNRAEDLSELRQYSSREDLDIYEPVLREVLCLFGQAIKTSFIRTNYGEIPGKYWRCLSQ